MPGRPGRARTLQGRAGGRRRIGGYRYVPAVLSRPDVPRTHLDIAVQPTGDARRVPNAPAGHAAVVRHAIATRRLLSLSLPCPNHLPAIS